MMTSLAQLGMAAGAGLVPPGYRFPLSRPLFDLPPDEEIPENAPEPFGMRFFRAVGEARVMAPVPYRYCQVRQVAVTDDESETPLIALPIAWERTTSGILDGKGPNVEEFTMDYCGDQ